MIFGSFIGRRSLIEIDLLSLNQSFFARFWPNFSNSVSDLVKSPGTIYSMYNSHVLNESTILSSTDFSDEKTLKVIKQNEAAEAVTRPTAKVRHVAIWKMRFIFVKLNMLADSIQWVRINNEAELKAMACSRKQLAYEIKVLLSFAFTKLSHQYLRTVIGFECQLLNRRNVQPPFSFIHQLYLQKMNTAVHPWMYLLLSAVRIAG